MKALIVEDEFITRMIMKKILEPYGEIDVAVNGREAVAAFQLAWTEDRPYDLICLDVMMPLLDGQQVLRNIRGLETHMKVKEDRRARILMTTALRDIENVKKASRFQVDGYLIKPVDKGRLIEEIRELGLIGETSE